MAALCRLSRSTRKFLPFSLSYHSPHLSPSSTHPNSNPNYFHTRSPNHYTTPNFNFISNFWDHFTLCQKTFFSAYSTVPQGSKLANSGKEDDDDEQLKSKQRGEASWVDLYLPRSARPYAKLARLDKPIGTWLLAWPCMW